MTKRFLPLLALICSCLGSAGAWSAAAAEESPQTPEGLEGLYDGANLAQSEILAVPSYDASDNEAVPTEPVNAQSLRQVNTEVLKLRQSVWDGSTAPADFYPQAVQIFTRHYGADYGAKVHGFLDGEAAVRSRPQDVVDFSGMIDADRKEFFTAMPKGADLHVHLTGAGSPKTWMDLAARFDTKFPTDAVAAQLKHMQLDPAALGLDLSQPTISAGQMSPAMRDALGSSLVTNDCDKTFMDFLNKWQIIGPISGDVRVFYPLLKQLALSAKAQNIPYLEVIESSDPSILETVAADSRRVEQETGVVVRMLAYNMWGDPKEQVDRGMDAANRLSGSGVVGYNMVANELNRPLQHYGSFNRLRQTMKNLRVTLHAGEVPGSADNIVNDMLLNAKRYGHATQVESDPIAMAMLYSNKTPVEVSLISNMDTGAMKDLSNHPLPKMLAWGVPVILASDDPGVFDSTLSKEYDLAQRQFGLSWGELKRISRDGIRTSFLDTATKRRVLAELDRRFKVFEQSDLFLKHKK